MSAPARLLVSSEKTARGKTTTFYMIVGLVTPTLGACVFMGDEDVTRMPMYRRARRGIGYLPQEESIFRKLTVEENLLAILETLPMTEDERDARCDELLKDFGLEHVRDNVAITLSGGEKRRVTIARALVTKSLAAPPRRTVQRRRSDGRARHPGNHSPPARAGPRRADHGSQRARDALRGWTAPTSSMRVASSPKVRANFCSTIPSRARFISGIGSVCDKRRAKNFDLRMQRP